MAQIAEIIKYEGDNSTFIWKHPCEDFNTTTQLIVHESQEAIFFMNGQALDLFGPGRHTLETQNIPLLRKFINIPTGGETPFHCEVYFINKTEQMAIKWGTDSKVQYVEPTYKFPLSIGASGEMALSVEDSRKLLVKLVGTERVLDRNQLTTFFRAFLMTRVKTYIAQEMKASAINIFEIDESLEVFSKGIQARLLGDFEEYGVTLNRFFVTTIVKPDGDPQYEKFKELHFRQYADIAEAKLKQQTDVIYAQTEAQKTVIESQALAQKRATEGYTYQQERGFDVAEHGLKALLEFAAELRAGNQRAHIQREDGLVFQPLRHIAPDNALGKALGDGGLANARLANKDGVILGLSRENADHIADFAVPADNGVQLLLPGTLHQVGAVLFQRVIGVLRVIGGDGLGLHPAQLGSKGGAGDSMILQDAFQVSASLAKDGKHQVFHRDILIMELFGALFRRVNDFSGLRGGIDLAAAAADPGQAVDQSHDFPGKAAALHAHISEHGAHQAILLGQQGVKQVLRGEILVALLPGQRLGIIQGLHTFAGILFSVHRVSFPGRGRPSLRFDPIIVPKLALSRREC